MGMFLLVVYLSPGTMFAIMLNFGTKDKWTWLKMAVSVLPIYIILTNLVLYITILSAGTMIHIILYYIAGVASTFVLLYFVWGCLKQTRYTLVPEELAAQTDEEIYPDFHNPKILAGLSKETLADPNLVYKVTFGASFFNPFFVGLMFMRFQEWYNVSVFPIYGSKDVVTPDHGAPYHPISLLGAEASDITMIIYCMIYLVLVYFSYNMLIFYCGEYMGSRTMTWILRVTGVVLLILGISQLMKLLIGTTYAADFVKYSHSHQRGMLFRGVPTSIPFLNDFLTAIYS